MSFKKIYLPIVVILLLQLFVGCNSESAPECFRKAGATVLYDVEVATFNKIHISPGIELIITQGQEQKVTVQTGKNLQEYITTEVREDGDLFITNSNNCNWTRGYNSTTVAVTTPVLERIYSASQFAVKSNGVLRFPSLTLESGLDSETASGTFEVELNSDNILIQDNQSCYYKISGQVTNLNVSFYSGDARFNGANLIADNIYVFHRSSNDIIVNPQQKISGTIYSTGNLVLKNQPPAVDVEQLYTGHIVYE